MQNMESIEEWVRAADAVQLLKPVFKSEHTAKMTICQRAYAGLIRARAEQFMVDERSAGPREIPKEFWWAEGHEALEQNWTTGDFETWIKKTTRLRAFSVSFLRAGIENMIPAATPAPPTAAAAASEPARNKGGRPKLDYWEELLASIAAKLYLGELQPKTQADIEAAMHQWIIDHGHEAGGETAVRDRARMVWRLIDKDEN
jgi:hypothetical protein